MKKTDNALYLSLGRYSSNTVSRPRILIEVPTGKGFKIGRSDENDLVLEGDHVSRFHGVILKVNGEWIYEDKSTAGSFVNEKPVHKSSARLFEGDQIRVFYEENLGSDAQRDTHRYGYFIPVIGENAEGFKNEAINLESRMHHGLEGMILFLAQKFRLDSKKVWNEMFRSGDNPWYSDHLLAETAKLAEGDVARAKEEYAVKSVVALQLKKIKHEGWAKKLTEHFQELGYGSIKELDDDTFLNSERAVPAFKHNLIRAIEEAMSELSL